MNQLILDAIRATGAANDRRLDSTDLIAMNAWLQANHQDTWAALHGDDEAGSGDRVPPGPGRRCDHAAVRQNAVNTVADGVYHIGFAIQCGCFLNEDGARTSASRWPRGG